MTATEQVGVHISKYSFTLPKEKKMLSRVIPAKTEDEHSTLYDTVQLLSLVQSPDSRHPALVGVKHLIDECPEPVYQGGLVAARHSKKSSTLPPYRSSLKQRAYYNEVWPVVTRFGVIVNGLKSVKLL